MYNLFGRIVAVILIIAMLLSLTACGPSQRTQALEAQYNALQQSPVFPNVTYNVTRPFVLMGKPIKNSEELARALANRPSVVVVNVDKEAYADLLVQNDLQNAGYKLVGKKNRGRNVEMLFQSDPAVMQAAVAKRNQEIENAGNQLNQSRQADSQAAQTKTTLGIAIGTIAIGVLASLASAMAN